MSKFLILILASCVLFPVEGNAQADQDAKTSRVKFNGSFRSRFEGWNWFTGNANSDYVYSGNILKLDLSQQRKNWDWQFELAVPFLLGMPGHAVAPAPQLQLGLGGNYSGANRNQHHSAMAFAKQGWIRWKNLFGDEHHSIKIGRFEFIDGLEMIPKNATLAVVKRSRVSQRILGPFGWSHVGRSFDGVHFDSSHSNRNFTFVGAMPTRGAFQVDGWGNLNIGFGYFSFTQQVGRGKSAGEFRALGMYYQDWRHVLKTDNRPTPVRQADMGNLKIGTFGGHYIHAFETSAGTFDLTVWGLGQTGKWGHLNHRAWATDVEAGWQPSNIAWKPWLRIGHTYGSGDGNASDGTHGTFFQMLPTPRLYAKTPFYNMMNSEDAFGTLTLRPHKAVSIVTEAHILQLANRNDQWLLGGGAFQPWSFGYIGRPSNGEKRLANLYDVGADWTVNRNTTLSAYWGYVDGRAVVRQIYPNGTSGQFGYLEANFKW